MTTIILHNDAIQALFPEGTEARVKLQDTVLGLLARQMIKHPTMAPKITEAIDLARKDVANEVLNELGVCLTSEFRGVSKYALSASARESIEETVKSSFGAIVRDMAMAKVPEIEGMVQRALEVQVGALVKFHMDQLSKASASIGTLNALKGGA